ncbi:MAG: ABC transporter ATP-binding protein [Chloroflexota bacterium]
MIWTKGLGKRYGGFRALEGLDLSVGRGEVYGFIGLNGAGKSTTIRLLCGLLRPNAGQIRIGGELLVWPDHRQVRRRIGYLPQSLRFHEAMSGGDILRFYCRLGGIDEGGARRRALGVEIPLERRAALLSPGQQRKLGLLLATLGDPELLFLDEPTAGLDPEGQREVRRIIGEWQGRGMTVFISSHILGEIQHLCSSIGILHRGRLLYSGPAEERYEIEVKGFSAARWPEKAPRLQPLPSADGSQRLLAKVRKERIPALVTQLVDRDVQVYGVRDIMQRHQWDAVVALSQWFCQNTKIKPDITIRSNSHLGSGRYSEFLRTLWRSSHRAAVLPQLWCILRANVRADRKHTHNGSARDRLRQPCCRCP